MEYVDDLLAHAHRDRHLSISLDPVADQQPGHVSEMHQVLRQRVVWPIQHVQRVAHSHGEDRHHMDRVSLHTSHLMSPLLLPVPVNQEAVRILP